jgi:THO complex subunit 7
MIAIRTEHETQNRTIQGQKSALDGIIGDLGSLRLLGKDREVGSIVASPFMTPGPEGVDAGEGTTEYANAQSNSATDLGNAATENVESGELDERFEAGEDKTSTGMIISASLNPSAKPFNPTLQKSSAAPSPTPSSKPLPEDDIEMGEVEEHPKNLSGKGKRKLREDLEEGEASDSSSALSDPPDD